MRRRLLFALSVLGMIAGLVGAYLHGMESKPKPPVFNPAPNPYAQGIYANGIVESYQTHGENINIYPEVAGIVVKILVAEGQRVERGTPLLALGDSVQRATVEQQKSQAEAALALLEELKAQPRKESLDVARAQVTLATASLKTSQDQLDKQRRSYELDPKSISKDTLDTAENAVKVARANLEVAQRQYDLTKAGAWIYDIRNQERQYTAAANAYAASSNLLDKYALKAPIDGVVLSDQRFGRKLRLPAGCIRHVHASDEPDHLNGKHRRVLGSAVLYRRDPPPPSAERRADGSSNVHSRDRYPRPARIRADPALRVAEDSAVRSAHRASRRQSPSGDLPVHATSGRPGVSGTARGCVYRRAAEITRAHRAPTVVDPESSAAVQAASRRWL